ncbi:MAG: hypothetical protein NXI09_00510 [Bacteroidetes bacterium]|nr:hypothetical protein [Bacteroidota bacterium]
MKKSIFSLLILPLCLFAQTDIEYRNIQLQLIKQSLHLEEISQKKDPAISIDYRVISPDTVDFRDIFLYEGVLSPVYQKVGSEATNRPSAILTDKLEAEADLSSALGSLLKQGLIDSSELDGLLKAYQRTNLPTMESLYQIGQERPTVLNPFFINDKYLLCFEISVHNKTNELQKLENIFTLSDGNWNLNQALQSHEIIQYHRDFPKLSFLKDDLIAYQQILDNFYFPNELYLAPGQKARRLVAFHPAALKNNQLEIANPASSSKILYQVNYKAELVHRNFEFIAFNYLFRNMSYYFDEKELTIYSPNLSIYFDENQLLVPGSMINEETDLLIIGESYGDYYFLKISDFRFSSLINEENKTVKQLRKNLKEVKP